MADVGKKKTAPEELLYGTATVGERGQIVIPAEARKLYNIETGDKLLIMGLPSGKGLMLCKIDAVRKYMTMFLESLDSFESETDNTDQ